MHKIIYGLTIMNTLTTLQSNAETKISFPTQCIVKKEAAVPTFFYNAITERFEFKTMAPDISSIGSKALNLSFLDSLGYVCVPSWASISSSIFREVVRRSPDLQKDLQFLYAQTERYQQTEDKAGLEAETFRIASALRHKIEGLVLPEYLVSSISALFDKVSKQGTKPIAVRSSALTEDLPGASFAGLYDSYLNICDFPSFLEALKKCWASTFNDRAVQYYMQKNLSLRDVYMSVVVMELVPASVSGTIFTTDITTGYNGIHIMANHGLEGVVGGDISADAFLLNPDNLMILKRTRGSKAFQYVPKTHSSGLDKVAMPEADINYCLTPEKVKELGSLVKRIASDYQAISQGPVDTEFAITKSGAIFLVQIRPVVMSNATQVDDIDFSALNSKKLKTIAMGKHSVFGVKHGRVKIIDDFQALESNQIQIDPDDIVVTTRTENQWTQYLSQFSGIITTEGNPTSHPVLISRERGVPCLVGVPDVMNKFRDFDGQWVTLDGFRKCVYAGKQPLKKVSIDKITEAFKTVEEEHLQAEEEMIKDLFLKNFMIESEGKYWITGITSSFSGALLDMVVNAYNLRDYAVNQSGISPPISFQTEQRIVSSRPGEGKVYDHWWTTHENQLSICQDMTVDNCLQFYLNKENKMQELLASCKEFNLTLASWKKIRTLYEEMTAYQLLGFLERYPLIHSTYDYANSLGVPRYFFEEYAACVPDYEMQEDVAFSNATKTLAIQLLELVDGKDLKEIDLHWVSSNCPDYYASLVAFSREYKFLSTEDWSCPPPIDKALAKVIEQARSSDLQIVEQKNYADAEEEFFVDCPDLRERIRLSIVKKLQQNNIHHLRPRAQWYLRDKMLILGKYLVAKKVLELPEEILSMPLDRLEGYIRHYEKNHGSVL